MNRTKIEEFMNDLTIDKKKYNPVTTVYKFVIGLVRKKVFFFIGLIFTILIGLFYWLGGLYALKDSLFNIFFVILFFALLYHLLFC